VKVFAILLVALCAGCASAGTTSNGQLTGAATPQLAVSKFLASARAQDLQAMSVYWGTEHGPARDVVPRDQLEKRELIMQCYLTHDKFAITGDAPGQHGSRVMQVALTKGELTRQTTFTVVRGPSERWYVSDLELEPLKDLCATS
jgi:hypothetical protein